MQPLQLPIYSIHPFCRGLLFDQWVDAKKTWKKHTKTCQNARPRFHANNGTNIHQNENQQERPQQSAQTSGNKTHKKSVSKLIATCGFGVSLGLGLKAERDVKAYVAP